MFVCKNCKSVDKFELMFSPDYRGPRVYEQTYNKKKRASNFGRRLHIHTRFAIYERACRLPVLRTNLYVGLRLQGKINEKKQKKQRIKRN